MAKVPKLYWDSCAWLGLLNGEADKKRELEIVYGQSRQGQFEIWTSTLSMIECRRLKSEEHEAKPLTAENAQTIKDIFSQPFVKPIPLDVQISEMSRTIWRSTPGLGKFQDAVHVASAIRWNVPILHTYDRDDLLHLDGSFDCLDGATLTICYPDQTTDGELFAKSKKTK